MAPQTIERGGKTYVLVEVSQYERLTASRGALAALPERDAGGNVDAVEFARATIARNITSRREAAGLSQAELAKAAGVRVETLSRLENAKHTADTATLSKIDAALAAAGSARRTRGPRGRAAGNPRGKKRQGVRAGKQA